VLETDQLEKITFRDLPKINRMSNCVWWRGIAIGHLLETDERLGLIGCE